MPRAPRAPAAELAVSRELVMSSLFALAAGFVFAAAAEWTCRVPAVRARLATPSYGMTPAFDVGFARLRTLAVAGERVDCFVLGSSVALRGMQPRRLAAAYERATGNRMRCFVVGIPALTPRGAAALAPILLADYRPRVLIYAVTAWDVRTDDSLDAPDRNDWVRYRNGSFTLRGWLTEHSYAYRAYAALRYRLRFSADLMPLFKVLERDIDADGFLPRTTVIDGASNGSDVPLVTAAAMAELDDSLRYLSHMVDEQGAALAMVEMPTPETVALLPAGDSTRVLDAVAAAAARAELPMRRVAPGEVGRDGFADAMHLNTVGATAFSERIGAWLGEVLPVLARPADVTVEPARN